MESDDSVSVTIEEDDSAPLIEEIHEPEPESEPEPEKKADAERKRGRVYDVSTRTMARIGMVAFGFLSKAFSGTALPPDDEEHVKTAWAEAARATVEAYGIGIPAWALLAIETEKPVSGIVARARAHFAAKRAAKEAAKRGELPV